MILVPSEKKQGIGLNTEDLDAVVARTHKLFEVPYAHRAYHGRSDVRQRPCQRDLGYAYPTLLGDLFNPIGALMRPKTCHFVGKNGPIDNLPGARFFRILGSVSVTRVVTVSVLRGLVRRPRASGEQGMMPTPNHFGVGNISCPSLRCTSEWWPCIEIKGVRLLQ